MDIYDVIMVFFLAFASTFSSASGIGGGAINSVLLMYFNYFSPKKAFPISNFMILTSSIAVFYLGTKLKGHQTHYSQVDYDMILISVPLLAMGAKLGEFMQRISPSILLDLILFIFILYSLYKYYKK